MDKYNAEMLQIKIERQVVNVLKENVPSNAVLANVLMALANSIVMVAFLFVGKEKAPHFISQAVNKAIEERSKHHKD